MLCHSTRTLHPQMRLPAAATRTQPGTHYTQQTSERCSHRKRTHAHWRPHPATARTDPAGRSAATLTLNRSQTTRHTTTEHNAPQRSGTITANCTIAAPPPAHARRLCILFRGVGTAHAAASRHRIHAPRVPACRQQQPQHVETARSRQMHGRGTGARDVGHARRATAATRWARGCATPRGPALRPRQLCWAMSAPRSISSCTVSVFPARTASVRGVASQRRRCVHGARLRGALAASESHSGVLSGGRGVHQRPSPHCHKRPTQAALHLRQCPFICSACTQATQPLCTARCSAVDPGLRNIVSAPRCSSSVHSEACPSFGVH